MFKMRSTQPDFAYLTNPFGKPTEDEIIFNSKPGFLYSNEFNGGRFFQMVTEFEDDFELKLSSKTMMKVVYIKDKQDINGLHIIKLINNLPTQDIKLSNFSLAHLKMFLSFISTIDLKSITEKKLRIIDESNIDDETYSKIRTILSFEDGQKIVESLLNDGIVSSKDIVNVFYRKEQLNIFQRMLNEQDYWKEYLISSKSKENKEEKAWQIFFAKNQWIFGYGLDYHFRGILQREFFASNTDADGSESVISDFLLGDKKFTTFVELKTPSTPIFAKSKNRSNSWSLSNELIDSVSQILEQKASGMNKINNDQLFDSEGKEIKQKAHDSKVILILGNWNQIKDENDKIRQIKEKTFELFRRDSRNIEFLTYDELFERAKFIVEAS